MRNNLHLGLISSFVPKKCGIATFSRDLINGIKENFPNIEILIAAAENINESYTYNKSVVTIMKTSNRQSYFNAAETFNKAKVDVVLLQHEYGLFGGPWTDVKTNGVVKDYPTGNYILDTINNLNCPLITTFHSVVSQPDPDRKAVIKQIIDKSVAVITMTQNSKRILLKDYAADKTKVIVIHHGVPAKAKKSKSAILKKFKLDKSKVYLSMTGLLSDNKGIDLVIKALPAVLKKHPETHLLVIGQTHPQILAIHDEEYRNSLIKLANQLKVIKDVTFINKYLVTSDLMEYLAVSSIYLTPYRDPDQAASGTLAYAIGSGLLIISTPYRYARELLAKQRGFLVPFEDNVSIAKIINMLIENPEIRQQIRHNIKEFSQSMAWPIVGKDYLKVIEQFVNK